MKNLWSDVAALTKTTILEDAQTTILWLEHIEKARKVTKRAGETPPFVGRYLAPDARKLIRGLASGDKFKDIKQAILTLTPSMERGPETTVTTALEQVKFKPQSTWEKSVTRYIADAAAAVGSLEKEEFKEYVRILNQKLPSVLQTKKALLRRKGYEHNPSKFLEDLKLKAAGLEGAELSVTDAVESKKVVKAKNTELEDLLDKLEQPKTNTAAGWMEALISRLQPVSTTPPPTTTTTTTINCQLCNGVGHNAKSCPNL